MWVGRTDAAQSPPGSPRGTAPGWDEQRKPGRSGGHRARLGGAPTAAPYARRAPWRANRSPCRLGNDFVKSGFCETRGIVHLFRGLEFVYELFAKSGFYERPELARPFSHCPVAARAEETKRLWVGRWTMRNTSRQPIRYARHPERGTSIGGGRAKAASGRSRPPPSSRWVGGWALIPSAPRRAHRRGPSIDVTTS